MFENASEARDNFSEKSLSSGFDQAGPFRVLEDLVILLGLPRITNCKLRERVIKSFAPPAITGNYCRVPRLGMRQRQRPAAEATILRKRFEIVDLGATFHVRQLTNVKLPSFELTPTQKYVGRTLRKTLTENHPVSLLLEWELEVNIRSQNGLVGFLDLKEERIVLVAALKQKHPALGTDAPNAHDFAGHIDDLVARQQNLSVVAQRINVRTQQTIEGNFDRGAICGVSLAHN